MAAKLNLLLLLLAGVVPASITACGVVGLTVTKAAAAAKPAESSAYDILSVRSHFMQMEDVQYAKNTETSFSCVDARTDNLYLSTPGGDYAEVSDGMYVFFNVTGVKPNASSIDFIFRQFMSKIASPKRPFYFHTDETKLASMFAAAATAGIKPKPVIFPAVQPKSEKEAKIWYSLLAKPEYQGCGHVRLMLYKYKEYGLDSPYVAEQLIKSFFKYWWPTPLNSIERRKVKFAIKRGPLAGRAVAIINNDGPACPDMTPMSRAAYGGSSIFVYHQKAVADFREKVLGPFFAAIAQDKFWGRQLKFDVKEFVKRSNDLAGEQLAFTINNLPPADSVNLYAVTYKTAQGGKTTDE